MYIEKLVIRGFKRFGEFSISFNEKVTVLVGDNDCGKSTVLEALALVLGKTYQGRTVEYAIDPYLFNAQQVEAYFAGVRAHRVMIPPSIQLEAYLHDDESLEAAALKGTNNSQVRDCPGLQLIIAPNEEFTQEIRAYAADEGNPELLPTEFYKVTWRSFAGNSVHQSRAPLKAARVDATHARLSRGHNRYISQTLENALSEEDQRELALAYKRHRFGFAQEQGIARINQHLADNSPGITGRCLSVQIDATTRGAWENVLAAHIDHLPFEYSGRGEQCSVNIRLAIADANRTPVVLVEEPENHLSHSRMVGLLKDITEKCEGQQVVISTHSTYVLNKLGIENLRLLGPGAEPVSLTGLAADTRGYFKKLPGYDTLRLVLARRAILVEGPSDELIVMRGYKDRHGRLPLEDGVEVIAVGLAFKRFAEIAALLRLPVAIVTDNDGDVGALRAKFAPYLEPAHPCVKVCFDDDETCRTLEPQLLKANSLEVLNTLLGGERTEEQLLKHMEANKTECALKLFETTATWALPRYIADAIAH